MRVFDGRLQKGDAIRLMASGKEYIVTETGWFKPGVLQQSEALEAGEVGYIAAAIKNITDATVGDTVTLAAKSRAGSAPRLQKGPADGVLRCLSH